MKNLLFNSLLACILSTSYNTFAQAPSSSETEESNSDSILFYGFHSANTEAIAISSNGKYLASAGRDNIIKVFEVDTSDNLSPILEFKGHQAAITNLKFNKDGSLLMSSGDDFKLNIWHVDSNFLKYSLPGNTLPINCSGIDIVPRFVFSVADDKKLRFFDLENLKKNKIYDLTETPTSIAITPNRRNFYVGTNNGKILVLDLAGKVQRTLEGHVGTVNSIDISMDGKFILTGADDKSIKLWDALTGKELHSFMAHSWKVTSVKFSLRGNYFVSGSNDGSVCIWDYKSKSLLSHHENVGINVRNVDFYPDLTKVALAGHSKDSEKGFWVIKTGLSVPKPASTPKNAGKAAAVSNKSASQSKK